MRYLFLNDISYLLHKRKKIMLLLILPLLYLSLNKIDNLSSFEVFNLSMGTNINMENYLVIELLIYLFTICFYLFLIIDIYTKDIETQLDLIFLRIKPVKWFLKKGIVFSLIIFIIRILQYSVGIIILIYHGYQIIISDYLYLFMIDYLYILLLQYLFLAPYMIGLVLYKAKKIMYILFFIIFCFIPKNILSLQNYTITIIILIYCIFLLNLFIIKKLNKKIFENL